MSVVGSTLGGNLPHASRPAERTADEVGFLLVAVGIDECQGVPGRSFCGWTSRLKG